MFYKIYKNGVLFKKSVVFKVVVLNVYMVVLFDIEKVGVVYRYVYSWECD